MTYLSFAKIIPYKLKNLNLLLLITFPSLGDSPYSSFKYSFIRFCSIFFFFFFCKIKLYKSLSEDSNFICTFVVFYH